MDNRRTIDYELWIPILIGGLSVIGIVAVLLIGRLASAPAQVDATPSATPFQYVYLGTEPAITTLVVEGSELPPTDEPGDGLPELVTPARPPVATPMTFTSTFAVSTQRFNTPVPTSTSASGPPLNPGTYDDVDSHFVYTGSWENRVVGEAYGGTLHVSLVPSSTSTITFRFIGRELRLVYLGGSTLGRLIVTIDGVSETIEQKDDTEWVSDTFTNGTHTVVITHAGGGSVNLDYVIIPEVPVTPSRTPTQNP